MRLIDADILIERMQKFDEESHVLLPWSRRSVNTLIGMIPTVTEVAKHGRWVCSGTGFDMCSECRKVFTDGYFTAMGIKPRIQFNYCPNCGAKMDGGKENA